MKIKPTTYAQILIQLTQNNESAVIAKHFWYSLQKNNQYKDFKKILNLLDEQYAKENNLLLTKVFSQKPLTEEETRHITDKLQKRESKKIYIKNVIRKKLTGIVVKVNDKEIDLSIEGKVNQLKQALKSS